MKEAGLWTWALVAFYGNLVGLLCLICAMCGVVKVPSTAEIAESAPLQTATPAPAANSDLEKGGGDQKPANSATPLLD